MAIIFLFSLFAFNFWKINSQQCLFQYSTSKCLYCAKDYYNSNGLEVIDSNSCLLRSDGPYYFVSLIKPVSDTNSYSNITFNMTYTNFTQALAEQNLNSLKYKASNLVFILTNDEHEIALNNGNSHLNIFSDSQNVNIRISSINCFNLTSGACDATNMAKIIIRTEFFHFFTTTNLTIDNMIIIPCPSSSNCQNFSSLSSKSGESLGIFVFENRYSSSYFQLNNVIFQNFVFFSSGKNIFPIISLGKMSGTLIIQNVKILNSAFDALIYQAKASVLSLILKEKYNDFTTDYQYSNANLISLNLQNLQVLNFNSQSITAAFSNFPLSFISYSSNVLSLNIDTIVINNVKSIYNNFWFILSSSQQFSLSNLNFTNISGLSLASSNSSQNNLQNIYNGFSIIPTLFTFSNTNSIQISNVSISSSTFTNLFLSFLFGGNISVQNFNISNSQNVSSFISNIQNCTFQNFNESNIQNYNTFNHFSFIEGNYSLQNFNIQNLTVSNFSQSLMNIQNTLLCNFSVDTFYVKNSNYFNLFLFNSPNGKNYLLRIQIYNIDSTFLVGFQTILSHIVFSNFHSENITDCVLFSTVTSLFKVVLFDRLTLINHNTSSKVALTRLTDGNISFINSYFEKIVILNKRGQPSVANMFFNEQNTNNYYLNTTFKNLGFLNWEDVHLSNGDEYTIMLFYNSRDVKVYNCSFSANDSTNNNYFINTIIAINSIEIINSTFVSLKSNQNNQENTKIGGICITAPSNFLFLNNTLQNLYCNSASDYTKYFKPNYANLKLFLSASTNLIIYGTNATIFGNSFINSTCIKFGGAIAVLNYEKVNISSNQVQNAKALFGSFMYIKSCNILIISNNGLQNSRISSSGITIINAINASFTNNIMSEVSDPTNSQFALVVLKSSNFTFKGNSIFQFSQLLNRNAFSIESANVSIQNSVFNGSVSTFLGSTLTILKCDNTNIDNTSISYSGNNQYSSVYFDSSTKIMVTNSVFSNNSEGLISVYEYSNISLSNVNFTNNIALSNSMLILQTFSEGFVTLNKCSFMKNSYFGDAFINYLANSMFLLQNLSFLGNQGKVLYVYQYIIGQITISSCSILTHSTSVDLIFGSLVNITFANNTIQGVNTGKRIFDIVDSFFFLINQNVSNVNLVNSTQGSAFALENTKSQVLNFNHSYLKIPFVFEITKLSEFYITETRLVYDSTVDEYIFVKIDNSYSEFFACKFQNFSNYFIETSFSSNFIFSSIFDSQVKISNSLINSLKLNSELLFQDCIFNYSNGNLFQIQLFSNFSSLNNIFLGNNLYFQVFEMTGIEKININNNTIKNINHTSRNHKSPFLFTKVSTLLIQNTSFSSHNISDCSLITFTDVKTSNLSLIQAENITFNKISFYNSLHLFLYFCLANNCFTNQICFSKFNSISSPTSIPFFYSEINVTTNSNSFENILGYSSDIVNFEFFLNSIIIKIEQNVTLIAGQPINLTFLIISATPNSSLLTIDSYSSAVLNEHEKEVSIQANNIVQSATKGKLLFQNLTLTAKPNSTINLEIMVNLKAGLFLSNDTIKSLTKIQDFQFYVRPCIQGEIYKASEQTCYICPRGTFSLINSKNVLPSSCQKCPENSFCPGKDLIIPNEGFWKANSSSTLILQCPNDGSCNSVIPWNGTICTPGYNGPFCFECAKGYGKNSKGLCEKCEGQQIGTLLFPLLYFFLFAIYAIFTTFTTIFEKESSGDSLNNLTNIIISHFQYLSMLSISLFDVKQVFNNVTVSVSNLLSIVWSQLSVNMCFFEFVYSFYNFGQVVAQIFFSYAIFLIIIVLSQLLYLLIKFSFQKIQYFKVLRIDYKRFFFTLVIVNFNFFYPSLLSFNISKFDCKKVDNFNNQFVMKASPKIICFSRDHLYILVFFTIPAVLFFGLIIPSFFFYTLLKQEHYVQAKIRKSKTVKMHFIADENIQTNQSNETFNINPNDSILGQKRSLTRPQSTIIVSSSKAINFLAKFSILKFLSKGYKGQFVWWEVNKLFLKFIFSLLANLSNIFNPSYVRIILLFLVISYLCLFINYRPFCHHSCNLLEIFSISFIVFTLIVAQGSFQGETSIIVNLVSISLNIVVLLLFCFYWVITTAKIFKQNAKKFRVRFSKTLMKLQNMRESYLSKRNSAKTLRASVTSQQSIDRKSFSQINRDTIKKNEN